MFEPKNIKRISRIEMRVDFILLYLQDWTTEKYLQILTTENCRDNTTVLSLVILVVDIVPSHFFGVPLNSSDNHRDLLTTFCRT